MPHTKRSTRKIHTTVGELAAAYYEAALAELKDETAAARIAQQMVIEAVRHRRPHGA